MLSVAETETIASLGAVESRTPEFPAELITTPPLFLKYCAAVCVVELDCVAKLMFATFAPWSAAQLSPLASALHVAYPVESATRMGMILAPQAIPATPMPLLPMAPITPATLVPWP